MKPSELTQHIEDIVIELLRNGVNVYVNENKPAYEVHYPNGQKVQIEGDEAQIMLDEADKLWDQTDGNSAIIETGHLIIYLEELKKLKK